MRKLLNLILIASFLLLITFCKNTDYEKNKVEQSNSTKIHLYGNDEFSQLSEIREDTLILLNPLFEFEEKHFDTVISDYSIKYKILKSEEIIITSAYVDGKGMQRFQYCDSEIKLEIRYKNRMILNKTFKRTDFAGFIPKNEITSFMITSLIVKKIDKDFVSILFILTIPDTDIHYLFELYFYHDGKFEIVELQPEFD